MQRSLPVFVSEHLLQVDDRRREFTDNQTHSGTGPGHGHSFLIQLSSLLFSSLLFSLSLSLSLKYKYKRRCAQQEALFSLGYGVWRVMAILCASLCRLRNGARLPLGHLTPSSAPAPAPVDAELRVASRPGCLESWANAGIGASSLSEASHSLCARLCSSESCSEASCCTNN